MLTVIFYLIVFIVKPDNTVVNDTNEVIKICDFGSALFDDESIITSELVSRYYRAPEIILGFKSTNKIDIWSLGCTLYELFTGQILFQGKNNNEMIKLFLELNGRFSNKILKRGEYTSLYFSDDLNYFKSLEIEESKGFKTMGQNVIIKNIDVNSMKKEDLKTLIFVYANKKKENEKKIKNFINFLEGCLNIDSHKRISAIDGYTHPFLWE